MKERVTSIMTHTGTMLSGTVTTEVAEGRHKAKISFWKDDKGMTIGMRVEHIGLNGPIAIGIPFGQIKQCYLETDESIASAKAS